jgi:3-methylfumaryl-CoA hydratase
MNLSDWIGRSETASDVITATPYAGLSSTLDRPTLRPPVGTPLPALWHWLYFLPLHRQSEIGPDGHPRRGDFLPPVPLPRRMWAGSRFEFGRRFTWATQSPISTIDEVRKRRSGSLVFVRSGTKLPRGAAGLRPGVHDPSRGAEAGDVAAPSPPLPRLGNAGFDDAAVPVFGADVQWPPDPPIAAMRRSRGVSGAAVHGPTLLLDLVRRAPDARIERFEFRAMRPICDLHPFFLQ